MNTERDSQAAVKESLTADPILRLVANLEIVVGAAQLSSGCGHAAEAAAQEQIRIHRGRLLEYVLGLREKADLLPIVEPKGMRIGKHFWISWHTLNGGDDASSIDDWRNAVAATQEAKAAVTP